MGENAAQTGPAQAPPPRPWRLLAVLSALSSGSLVALVAAFVWSFALAEREFALANLSEQQASSVETIATLARSPASAAAIGPALDRYRAEIERELAALPPGEASGRRQRDERRAALRMQELARDPAANAALRDLASALVRREAAEVGAARAQFARIHRRANALAIALALVALVCAGCGWALLLRRNRDLAQEVAHRTARITAIDHARRQFFAQVSHELRTPITAMSTAAQVALTLPPGCEEALRDGLEHAVAEAGFLAHRVEDLLALSRAEDGRIAMAPAPCDLGAIAAAAVAAAAPYGRTVEVRLAITGQAQPLPLTGDARWLRQALLAVIENGLKFATLGSTLDICLSRADDTVVAEIADDGPGIAPAELPRIFETWYQAEAGRQHGGSGLGLALARWIVERHGGTIAAANRPEGGCCIRIALPAGVS